MSYNGVIGYAALVLEEVAVGLLLGGGYIILHIKIILFSGKIIDMDTGISMAQIYDPTTRMQVGIMGNFYYYLVIASVDCKWTAPVSGSGNCGNL